MPRWVVAAYTAESSRTKARFAGELLFSCLRPPERHTAGPDAGIEDQPGDPPSRPYAVATVARTPHSAQDLPHRDIPAIEGSQLR